MSNITTENLKFFGWLMAGLVPIIITGTLAMSAIRNDIKDGRKDAHQENVNINRKIDSLHHDYQYQFRDIWAAIVNLDSIRTVKTRTIYIRPKPVVMGLFTQRIINGQRVFVPYVK